MPTLRCNLACWLLSNGQHGVSGRGRNEFKVGRVGIRNSAIMYHLIRLIKHSAERADAQALFSALSCPFLSKVTSPGTAVEPTISSSAPLFQSFSFLFFYKCDSEGAPLPQLHQQSHNLPATAPPHHIVHHELIFNHNLRNCISPTKLTGSN